MGFELSYSDYDELVRHLKFLSVGGSSFNLQRKPDGECS
jgi:hypothetical protein